MPSVSGSLGKLRCRELAASKPKTEEYQPQTTLASGTSRRIGGISSVDELLWRLTAEEADQPPASRGGSGTRKRPTLQSV